MNAKRRRVVLISLAVLTAAALLRVIGFVRVDLYSATLISDHELWKSRIDDPSASLTLVDRTQKPSTKTVDEMRNTHLGFRLSRHLAAPYNDLRSVINMADTRFSPLVARELGGKFGASAPGGVAPITLFKAGIDGPYWMPLEKRGKCYYAVDLPKPPDSQERRILWGEIDFYVVGLLTPGDLEELLAKKIAAQVYKYDSETRH